ncbi:TetR family transcriptional regulator [Streptococcus porcinus]|uniref:TetR/AcrR family transcriptional regulator n=1 Tax=Streptococcus porcinus TaxID=1340 RepID=UPI0010CAB337|nr:TetR/AcrR family transcriptional regulator [Streptococcus porcinus]VTS25385.1 TetR family transcriptional regulator [Streptococcus porcinus]
MSKRQTETLNFLREALIALLAEKDFETISVSDLTKRAGINRGTFYLHFRDKYEMINYFKDEYFNKLFQVLDAPEIATNTRELLIETLTVLAKQFDFIAAISQSQSLHVKEILKDFIYKVLLTLEDHQKIVRQQYGGIPFEYALEVYLASIESIISYWIKTGGQQSAEELTDIILKTVGI